MEKFTSSLALRTHLPWQAVPVPLTCPPPRARLHSLRAAPRHPTSTEAGALEHGFQTPPLSSSSPALAPPNSLPLPPWSPGPLARPCDVWIPRYASCLPGWASSLEASCAIAPARHPLRSFSYFTASGFLDRPGSGGRGAAGPGLDPGFYS